MKHLPGVIAGPLAALLLSGAASTLMAEEWVDTGYTGAAELYVEKCGMCHQGSGMGTTLLGRRLDTGQALLENRRDLQPEFIRTVVRSGFNNMFPISRGEVSDEQLDKIVTYLTRERS